MKKLLFPLSLVVALGMQAQEKVEPKKGGLMQRASGLLNKGGGLSNDDIINGLKEALSVGASRSASQLSAADGFFKNAAIKVLLPPEAQKIETTLRSAGLGNLVDDAILSMNRAAEDAAKSATPIFVDAIKSMTLTDGMDILKGNDSAATTFLKGRTLPALTEAFRPVIESSLEKTNATKHWKNLVDTYNRLPTTFRKINPDLAGYVTERSMGGLFYQVGLEEQKIRNNPAARTTELLKKVFN